MIEVIDSREIEQEQKTVFEKGKEVGGKLLNYGKNTLQYVKENPVDTIVKIGAVATAMTAIMAAAKNIDKANKVDKTVFSKDIGEEVVLNKKLNNNDKVELDYRVKTGQTKIEALNEMGLIK